MTLDSIKALIDHTLLKADAVEADVHRICEEARSFGFAAVCVNPGWIKTASDVLRGSSVRPCTVVGFPLGATFPEAKAFEAEQAIQQGAREVDMMINVGALKDRNYQLIAREVSTVLQVCHGDGALLKVIIETAYLTEDEKIKACEIVRDLGADFVKTSTGFASSGAQVEDVALMRRVVGRAVGVKAAGGIRDWITFQSMVQAGANRIGTSSGIKILQEAANAIKEG
jgi:deoxyribose-phosphate aldolase